MHNKALLSPLSWLGRLTLRSSRPKALRYERGSQARMLVLRKPKITDLAEIKELYEQSVNLHNPWVYAPQNYEAYLNQENRYFVCLAESGKIVGTFNIS